MDIEDHQSRIVFPRRIREPVCEECEVPQQLMCVCHVFAA
jgi:hypothetical protein